MLVRNKGILVKLHLDLGFSLFNTAASDDVLGRRLLDLSFGLRRSLSNDEHLLVLEFVFVVGSLDFALDGILNLGLGLGFLMPVLVEDGRRKALRKLEGEGNLIVTWYQAAALEEEDRGLVFKDGSVRFLLVSDSFHG